MSSAPLTPDAAAGVKRRRPILIWITQTLAIILGPFALFHATRWTLLAFTGERPFTPRLVGTVILQITFGVLAILVLVGLIRPATWARWLSVIFAICVTVLFFFSQHGATPLTLTPSERVWCGRGGDRHGVCICPVSYPYVLQQRGASIFR